jgi:hypothetical protein
MEEQERRENEIFEIELSELELILLIKGEDKEDEN